MNWKEFVTNYLTFTRRDRIAIIAIILLIAIVCVLPKVLSSSGISKPATPDTAWMAAMKRIELKEAISTSSTINTIIMMITALLINMTAQPIIITVSQKVNYFISTPTLYQLKDGRN